MHAGLTDHTGSTGFDSSTDSAGSSPSIHTAGAGRNIKDELTRIIANRIQLDETELDEDMNFKDMGVDSISGVEIVRDLNESFSLQLDTIDIYDYYTLNLLAAHIGRKHGPLSLAPEADVPGVLAVSGTSSVNQEDRDLLELLSRLNEDELDVDEVAQFLEVYYE